MVHFSSSVLMKNELMFILDGLRASHFSAGYHFCVDYSLKYAAFPGITLVNSLKEIQVSPLVSASWMVLSAMLPSCSSEIFTPTIILKTWKRCKSPFYLYFLHYYLVPSSGSTADCNSLCMHFSK